MNLKSHLNALRRRILLLIVVVALSAAMLPTAAFASGFGNQGRAWDPGPRQSRGFHRPARQHDMKRDHRPMRCDAFYRVKRGDTLSMIAKHFRVPLHQIAKVNGIRNPNRIFAGQVLCIPW